MYSKELEELTDHVLADGVKEDTDWHNKMTGAWIDKCTEVILEARLEHINDEQALRVFDEYAQQLGI